jgi:hypothetical protein
MLFTFPDPLMETRRPKFSKSKVALFLLLPITFGTNINSGPFETNNLILLPFGIASDLSGVWDITCPLKTPSLNLYSTSTSNPDSVNSDSACSPPLPTNEVRVIFSIPLLNIKLTF